MFKEVATYDDVRVGDKVEILEPDNDVLIQGWVEKLILGWDNKPYRANLKGGKQAYLRRSNRAIEIRILHRPGPKIGDDIEWGEVFDLPAGSVVVRSDGELMCNPNRVTWIVTKRANGEPRLRNAEVGGRTHDRSVGRNGHKYRIQYINENKG